MPKFQFVLLIHGHQPIGNFDSVIEQAYTHSYLPFVAIAREASEDSHRTAFFRVLARVD